MNLYSTIYSNFIVFIFSYRIADKDLKYILLVVRSAYKFVELLDRFHSLLLCITKNLVGL